MSAALVAGDFNGDGKLDLALANSDGSVSILLGNGDGTFQAPQTFATGTTDPTQMVVGDFNRDGKLDVATATYETSSFNSIFWATEMGLSSPTSITLHPQARLLWYSGILTVTGISI